MEELNLTVKGIHEKASHLETEIMLLSKTNRKLSTGSFHMEKNAEFVDEQIIELQTGTDQRKNGVLETSSLPRRVQPKREPKV